MDQIFQDRLPPTITFQYFSCRTAKFSTNLKMKYRTVEDFKIKIDLYEFLRYSFPVTYNIEVQQLLVKFKNKEALAEFLSNLKHSINNSYKYISHPQYLLFLYCRKFPGILKSFSSVSLITTYLITKSSAEQMNLRK